jgi:DNA-binding FadR family transcriptional regulator
MTEITPLRVPKTAEILAARLRTQIVRGELQQGDHLPNESELVEVFGVSRHVLREAFRILESERLLTVRRGAHGGAVVLAPDPGVAGRHVGVLLQVRGTSLHEVQHTRLALETAAVRALAGSPDVGRAVVVLQECNERARQAAGDPAAFSLRSFEFHHTLVELAGNRASTLLMELMGGIIQRHIIVRQSAADNRPAERLRANELSVKANAKMLRLLETGDADAAETYWRKHLTEVLRHLAGADGPVNVVDLFT